MMITKEEVCALMKFASQWVNRKTNQHERNEQRHCTGATRRILWRERDGQDGPTVGPGAPFEVISEARPQNGWGRASQTEEQVPSIRGETTGVFQEIKGSQRGWTK